MELFGISIDALRGFVLVGLIVAFGGICAWAWSGHRREAFRHMSQLPLEEDDGRIPSGDGARGVKE